MTAMGIIILVVVAVAILYLRHYTNTQGSSAMKTAMKVGDFFVWIRFIGFGILFLFLMFIILAAKNK
jgi:hypothetical protein